MYQEQHAVVTFRLVSRLPVTGYGERDAALRFREVLLGVSCSFAKAVTSPLKHTRRELMCPSGTTLRDPADLCGTEPRDGEAQMFWLAVDGLTAA
jgi:hypothetical protein